MKATELMIGNWVKFKVNKTPNTIESINFSGVCTLDKIGVVMVDGLKPIPLTEEWLIKFGFQDNTIRIGEMQIIFDEDYGSYYLGDEQEIGLNPDLEIKHVHQLQNLYFALTNEELTIKL